MADEVDLANDNAEKNLRADLDRQAELARLNKKVPRGTCYYCEEDVSPNLIFCDKHCEEDYNREEKIKAIRGR